MVTLLKNQKGFTLIELVVVIVILGILAAVAVPKYIDLTDEASQAAVNGVAGGLSSASAINYAAVKAGKTQPAAVTIAKCTDVGPLLQTGLPAGYTITDTEVTADTAETCTLTYTKGGTDYQAVEKLSQPSGFSSEGIFSTEFSQVVALTFFENHSFVDIVAPVLPGIGPFP